MSTPQTVDYAACYYRLSDASVCASLPYYGEREGKKCCVLHYPGEKEVKVFSDALHTKLNTDDYNFQGVWFPYGPFLSKRTFASRVGFSFATFNGSPEFEESVFSEGVTFLGAVFHQDANFSKVDCTKHVANFSSAVFNESVDFHQAKFNIAQFDRVKFKGPANFSETAFEWLTTFRDSVFDGFADFSKIQVGMAIDFERVLFKSRVTFKDGVLGQSTKGSSAKFRDSEFGELADFSQTVFGNEVDFSSANFINYVLFSADETRPAFPLEANVNFQHLRAGNPEHFSFHSVVLKPRWFINADSRKFNLNSVDWHPSTIEEDLEHLGRANTPIPHRQLSIAYRRLAVNAEENDRFEEASGFRYRSMEVTRLGHRRGRAFWRLSWWYWIASGYGERFSKALLVLFVIWLASGLLYTRVGFARSDPFPSRDAAAVGAMPDNIGAPLKFSRALTYSAGVMTLQRPEPRPATTAAQSVVLLETILGPIQAALLALAIRRKFMR